MTLSKLRRDLGLDVVPRGFHTSFSNCAEQCPSARRKAMESHLAYTV